MASDVMALTSNADKYALSLGVELHHDGSIDAASIIVAPSLIHVDYRLTYDQVDEMLDEGVGYTEEWEVGALLSAATKRREHRVGRGSTEGFVPCPIPKSFLTVTNDDENEGSYNIELKIETTHNSGSNITAGRMEGGSATHYDPYASPLSSSQLIVTEMMILGMFLSCQLLYDFILEHLTDGWIINRICSWRSHWKVARITTCARRCIFNGTFPIAKCTQVTLSAAAISR